MSDEEIRIAIAEACPQLFEIHETWRRDESGRGAMVKYLTRARDVDLIEIDPLNDLNAMHEAEKTLYAGTKATYLVTLAQVVAKGHQSDFIGWDETHATARQRAEAFLHTLGKWPTTPAP